MLPPSDRPVDDDGDVGVCLIRQFPSSFIGTQTLSFHIRCGGGCGRRNCGFRIAIRPAIETYREIESATRARQALLLHIACAYGEAICTRCSQVCHPICGRRAAPIPGLKRAHKSADNQRFRARTQNRYYILHVGFVCESILRWPGGRTSLLHA